MKLKFLSLGSGSSGNSYLLSDGRTSLLIDAGIGIRTMKSTLWRYGHALNNIHALLLTHDHGDHARTAGKLATRHKIPVYATRSTFQGIDNNPVINPKVPYELRREVAVGNEFTLGAFTICVQQVSHDSWDCVSYTLSHEGRRFVIITDCGKLTEELCQEISQADYLVLESNHDEEMLRAGRYPEMLKRRILSPRGHLSNAACAQALSDYLSERCQHVWLCHLSRDNNRPEIAYSCAASALERFPDVQLTVLNRTEPMLFELDTE